MKKGVALLAISLLSVFYVARSVPAGDDVVVPVQRALNATLVYSNLQLNDLGLSSGAFNLAVKGWQKLKTKGEVDKDIIAICDFTQSSVNKRLYIIDMNTGRLLFNTLVAHGKNTGEEFARYFSNQPSSNKSSLGFYKTGSTYQGEHGLSLKLEGEEPGFNNNAEGRAIVMHGADYVNSDFISQWGRLGRSFGCPAIPMELRDPIINTLKDGCCLFVYYPDKSYLAGSKLLN